MTEQELAAFKAKLVYQLDTTTNEEAQLISDMVDAAAGGGGSSLLHCSVTFINNTGTEQTIIGIIYATENNALSTYPSTMLPVGTSVFDVYYSEDSEGMWAEVTVENCVITASNEINCTLDSGDSSFIYLTNYENPSSITLTVTEEQAGGATTK